MTQHPVKQLLGSVFTRLLVTIFIAGLAITFMVITGFIMMRTHSQGAFERNLMLYTGYLKADLGDPPDEIRAREIARRSGMVILFEHPQQTWQTGSLPQFFSLDRAWVHRDSSGLVFGNFKGHQFIRMSHGGGELTFITPRGPRHAVLAVWFLAGLALALLSILAGAYFIIRKTLNPLRSLKAGVEAVGAGDLDHRILASGAGEFRDLAGAFNAMTARLQRLLHSKDQLLLDVSHELRSPITRLKVQAEFVDDADARESLRSDIDEMEAMVTTLLESARLRHMADAMEPAVVDMGDLIRSLLLEFEARPPGIETGPLVSAPANADAERMKTVLRNLLDNALKYSLSDDLPVAISLKETTQTLCITVEDHGEGIPKEDLPHLFEPFYRVDRSRSRKTGGYGLGLSLCKAIVDAHEGDICIESTVGEGTRVTVRLPLGNKNG